MFSHSNSPFPLLVGDSYSLLARTSSPEQNIRTNALEYWRPERFEEPFIEDVSNPGTFVNQAFYDTDSEQLVITVNGGEATTETTDITVANLPAETSFLVMRDGVEYGEFRREGDRLIITTSPLSGVEESYVVEAGVPGSDISEPDDDTPDIRAEPDIAEVVDQDTSSAPSQTPSETSAEDDSGCNLVSWRPAAGTTVFYLLIVCVFTGWRRRKSTAEFSE